MTEMSTAALQRESWVVVVGRRWSKVPEGQASAPKLKLRHVLCPGNSNLYKVDFSSTFRIQTSPYNTSSPQPIPPFTVDLQDGRHRISSAEAQR